MPAAAAQASGVPFELTHSHSFGIDYTLGAGHTELFSPVAVCVLPDWSVFVADAPPMDTTAPHQLHVCSPDGKTWSSMKRCPGMDKDWDFTVAALWGDEVSRCSATATCTSGLCGCGCRSLHYWRLAHTRDALPKRYSAAWLTGLSCLCACSATDPSICRLAKRRGPFKQNSEAAATHSDGRGDQCSRSAKERGGCLQHCTEVQKSFSVSGVRSWQLTSSCHCAVQRSRHRFRPSLRERLARRAHTDPCEV